MADIFVSYTSSDRDWAFWIAQELIALGHVTRIYEWEIKGGEDIYAWMETRLEAADHMLSVMSEAYFESPYASLERHAAFWAATKKRPRFALPVVVKPCQQPTLNDQIRRCDLVGLDEAAARNRFHDFMRDPGPPGTIVFPGPAAPPAPVTPATPVAFPGRKPALSNIPITVPLHFRGRDDALAEIATTFEHSKHRVFITALHGLRGVGKTTLAAAYAEQHRENYRATWWLRAQTESGLRADLVSLGVRLGWVEADAKEEPALAAVMERLRHEGDGILLIYDNAIDAESLKPYLPRGGASRVLITTNDQAMRSIATPIEIRLWPKQIGADFLVARTGWSAQRDTAEALSEDLHGLPLAHEQAAAYCEQLGVGFADYRRRFAATPARLLDSEKYAPAEYHDRMTVAKTFALAIDEAAKLHPGAEPLIVHAALLAPEPIPLFLFAEGREAFGEPIASALSGDGPDEAVAALRRFALVDRETVADERDSSIVTDSIRLHRLVRQVAAVRREGAARDEALRALIRAIGSVYPKEVFDDPKTWPRARRLDALALLAADPAVPTGVERQQAWLLDRLASYRTAVSARPLFERALAICEKILGPEHPDTATSLNNLGGLLQAQGDFAGARPLFERALALREKVLGPEHPTTAIVRGNLADLAARGG